MPHTPVPPFSEYIPERHITIVTEVDARTVVSRLFRGRVSVAIALLSAGPPAFAIVREAPGRADAWAQHTRVVQAVRAGAYEDGWR